MAHSNPPFGEYGYDRKGDRTRGNSVYAEYRGHKLWISYHSTWARADVDVVNITDLRRYSFELAIMNPGTCRLGDRLTDTVKAWIDGTIAQQASGISS